MKEARSRPDTRPRHREGRTGDASVVQQNLTPAPSPIPHHWLNNHSARRPPMNKVWRQSICGFRALDGQIPLDAHEPRVGLACATPTLRSRRLERDNVEASQANTRCGRAPVRDRETSYVSARAPMGTVSGELPKFGWFEMRPGCPSGSRSTRTAARGLAGPPKHVRTPRTWSFLARYHDRAFAVKRSKGRHTQRVR
jgi:hypothetical protein